MKLRGLSALTCLMLWPHLAVAHGAAGEQGLSAGMLHPISGADHLLAMLSVGALSALIGGKVIWQLPVAFLIGLFVGGAIGVADVDLGPIEIMIAASLVVLGLQIAWDGFRKTLAPMFSAALVFGVFHGNAHGLEIPELAAPGFYVLGFMVTSIFIHVAGIFLAELLSSRIWSMALLRAMGVVSTAVGVLKLVKQL